MSTPTEQLTGQVNADEAKPASEAGSAESEPAEIPRGHPRDEMMAVIAERHRRRYDAEMGVEDSEGTVEDEDADEAQEDVPADDSVSAEALSSAEPSAPGETAEPSDLPPDTQAEPGAEAPGEGEPTSETVYVEVYADDPDGFRGHVPRAAVEAAGGVEAYGKRLAADIRARRAQAKEQAVAAREAQVAQREAALREAQRSQAPAAPVLDASAQAELDALAQDYPEEFVDTRRRVLEMQSQMASQLDPQAIAKQVLETTREEARVESQQRADKWFSENYAHVERDPDLMAVAERKARELLQADLHADPLEVVRLAGEHADQFARRNTASDSAEADARVERKRQLAGQPTARSVRHAPAPEPPPPTSSDVIREMRMRRGQPV